MHINHDDHPAAERPSVPLMHMSSRRAKREKDNAGGEQKDFRD